MTGSSGIKSSAERQGGDRTSRLSWIAELETEEPIQLVHARPGVAEARADNAHARRPHGREQPGGAVSEPKHTKPYGLRVRPAAPSPPH